MVAKMLGYSREFHTFLVTSNDVTITFHNVYMTYKVANHLYNFIFGI